MHAQDITHQRLRTAGDRYHHAGVAHERSTAAEDNAHSRAVKPSGNSGLGSRRVAREEGHR